MDDSALQATTAIVKEYNLTPDALRHMSDDVEATPQAAACGRCERVLGHAPWCSEAPEFLCPGCGEDRSGPDVHLCDYPTEAFYQEV